VTFKTGDALYFSTRDGAERIRATVLIASGNGRSLMLTFEAVVEFPGGVYVGNMPILQMDDGRWIELIGQHEVRIEAPQ
jgi:hypothetical protein